MPLAEELMSDVGLLGRGFSGKYVTRNIILFDMFPIPFLSKNYFYKSCDNYEYVIIVAANNYISGSL